MNPEVTHDHLEMRLNIRLQPVDCETDEVECLDDDLQIVHCLRIFILR